MGLQTQMSSILKSKARIGGTIMGQRSIITWLGLLLSVLPLPCAAENEEPGPRVVYAGAEDEPGSAGQVAAMMALLKPPVMVGEPPVHVDRMFPPGQLVVLGPAETAACFDGPMDLDTYQASLKELYQAAMALEETRPLIQRIKRSQPCLTEPIEPQELAQVSFMEGVVEFGDEHVQAAESAFSEVFAIEPAYPWDKQYSPDTQLCFANASTQMIQRERAVLQIVVPAQGQVWLDGRPLSSPMDENQVAPGRHLLQFRASPDADMRATVVELGDAAHTIIVEPTALVRDEEKDPGFLEASRVVFNYLEGADEMGAPDYLVSLAPTPLVWHYEAEEQLLVPVEISNAAVATALGNGISGTAVRRPGPSPVTPVLVAVGVALVAAGGVTAGLMTKEIRDFNHCVEQPEECGDGALYPFEETEGNALYGEWIGMTRQAYTGYALLAAGGAMLAVSVPIGIISARQNQKISLSASLRTNPDSRGEPFRPDTIDGFHFSLTVQ